MGELESDTSSSLLAVHNQTKIGKTKCFRFALYRYVDNQEQGQCFELTN